MPFCACGWSDEQERGGRRKAEGCIFLRVFFERGERKVGAKKRRERRERERREKKMGCIF